MSDRSAGPRGRRLAHRPLALSAARAGGTRGRHGVAADGLRGREPAAARGGLHEEDVHRDGRWRRGSRDHERADRCRNVAAGHSRSLPHRRGGRHVLLRLLQGGRAQAAVTRLRTALAVALGIAAVAALEHAYVTYAPSGYVGAW